MRAVRICVSGAGKSRTVLLQKRTASRVQISSNFGHMLKYLLTKLGRAGSWCTDRAHNIHFLAIFPNTRKEGHLFPSWQFTTKDMK